MSIVEYLPIKNGNDEFFQEVCIVNSINVIRSPVFIEALLRGSLNKFGSNETSIDYYPSELFLTSDEGNYWVQNFALGGGAIDGDVSEYGFNEYLQIRKETIQLARDTIQSIDPEGHGGEEFGNLEHIIFLDSIEELRERVVLGISGVDAVTLLLVKLLATTERYLSGDVQNLEKLSVSVKEFNRSGRLVLQSLDRFAEAGEIEALEIDSARIDTLRQSFGETGGLESVRQLSEIPHSLLIGQIQPTEGFQEAFKRIQAIELPQRDSEVEELCAVLHDDFDEFNSLVNTKYGFEFLGDGPGDGNKQIYCEILRVFVRLPDLMQDESIYSVIFVDPDFPYAAALRRQIYFGNSAIKAFKNNKGKFQQYVIHEAAHVYMANKPSKKIREWLEEEYGWRSVIPYKKSNYKAWIEELYGADITPELLKLEMSEFSVSLVLLTLGPGGTYAKYGMNGATKQPERGEKLSEAYLEKWMDETLKSWSNVNFVGLKNYIQSNKKLLIQALIAYYDGRSYSKYSANPAMKPLLIDSGLYSRQMLLSAADRWYENIDGWYLSDGADISFTLHYNYQEIIGVDCTQVFQPVNRFGMSAFEEYFAELSVDYVEREKFGKTEVKALPPMILEKMNSIYST